jgi:Xaa-Pro aminopeptidase
MTTSNEPGYYEAGAFGIRVENVCITVDACTANNFGDKRYCTFETVTMTPISTALINKNMMTASEISWLNKYHSDVRSKLLPGVRQFFPQAESWLMKETNAI